MPDARRAAAEPGRSEQIAVIDVGSNSVRLIVYRREGRAFWPIFNEKLLAGLGRGVAETGVLSPEGVMLAMRTLRRFRMILDARGVDATHVFATAAVREARDGADFAARIQSECGFAVETLSGGEEARLSALGVVAGGVRDGLVGDLGGSSLELCMVRDGAPGRGVTLKLGPLAVLDGKRDMRALRKLIDAALDDAGDMFGDAVDFYAVGGAWRSLARIDMTLRDYPLHVLHHYQMTRARARAMAEFVAGQSVNSLGDVDGVSSRRVALLPYAALLLDGVLRRGPFTRVVVSAYGVREGVLFDRMNRAAQADDPLLSGTAAFARRLAPASTVGEALADWIDPVFAPHDLTERERLLRRAAARLADIGSAMHPDHRADLVADQVLYAPFAGLDHPERAFLSTALYHRYAGPAQPPKDFAPRRLASPDMLERARSLGLAMRLGCSVSGRSPSLLGVTSVAAADGRLRLSVRAEGAALITDQAEKRLKHLASALGLKPETAETE